MVDDVLVKKIVDPFNQEKEIKRIELDLYSKLIKTKEYNNDNDKVAEELYNQLIDTKKEKN